MDVDDLSSTSELARGGAGSAQDLLRHQNTGNFQSRLTGYVSPVMIHTNSGDTT